MITGTERRERKRGEVDMWTEQEGKGEGEK
jgi:hypothetical protein